ncbi:hypothetical protein CTI12_AA445500 [Artemisia annua]|uniref:Uncharacterized protein n=1 Tax=Artemisia annua TaxID=35608 RepID=A0A2U1LWF7_ARTAN|nr:hypothetical protein CTI12_AA445500 [Artemisia annua]
MTHYPYVKGTGSLLATVMSEPVGLINVERQVDTNAATRPQVGLGHLQKKHFAGPLLTHDTGTEHINVAAMVALDESFNKFESAVVAVEEAT